MIKVTSRELKKEFKRILVNHAFSEEKAEICAEIFTENTLVGVPSHGINRFPGFIKFIEQGYIRPDVEPEKIYGRGALENWNGHSGPGVYNASFCMDRAVSLAKEYGIGCATLFNNNHWMRGGYYGWQAAEAGCVGICFTNSKATMSPWGGKAPRIGNNPLVIAAPYREGPVVLDMAISQFSFGKMKEYQSEGKELPYEGGYDEAGNLTKDPGVIMKTMNAAPIGRWKGSGLSILLDVLVAALTGGNTTKGITEQGVETNVSQCFIAVFKEDLQDRLIEEILNYTKSSNPAAEIRYPGERAAKNKKEHLKNGVFVREEYWEQLLKMR